MAREPNDLVLRILREIQATLSDHGRLHEEHRRAFERLRHGQDEIRESIVTALGLSAHANVRNDLMEDRLGDLEERIGRIDELEARVMRLEAEEV
ncbi:MAG: hypothetical protein M3453_11420 [Pseudomonadota bacterium]|nr:hypothetical protein [Pseudomonadota bacterium]